MSNRRIITNEKFELVLPKRIIMNHGDRYECRSGITNHGVQLR